MDRSTVTTAAKAMGARIRTRFKDMTIYEFQSEDELLDFREMIPFWTLWTSGLNLNVYFNDPRELPDN